MVELRNRYPEIACNGKISYGGSQLLSAKKNMRQCGCGVIACADTWLYLQRYHPEYSLPSAKRYITDYPISNSEYQRLIESVSPRLFPLIPHFGINGLSLVIGLKLLFTRESKLKSSWGVKKDRIIAVINEMLGHDIPVILAIGPNFPFLLGKRQLNFYIRTKERQYQKTLTVNSHYVVVTGMDENWLKISSWGREYYINIPEYMDYIEKYSSPIVSNIVHIRCLGP